MRFNGIMLRILPFIFIFSGLQSFAQRTLETKRTLITPKIDGIINESCWGNMIPAEDFINNSPDYGKPAGKRTMVWVLYDDQAIYVAAKLYDNPADIRRQLTARDKEQRQDVDIFSIFLDTYNDDQNAFQFVVTSRNVQSDARVSPAVQTGFGTPSDYSWDAVWESNVHIDQEGWTVEMRIPYISLRFSKADVQHWGINFQRFSRKTNESSFWNPVDPNKAGFVNQFGDLNGIYNIKPPLRLSFLPYVSTGYRNQPTTTGREKEFLRNGGMDLKWGVNESFTMDATLVPDFGQVISDNNVLNLSPYEVRFVENRPFFTEGTELFNKAGLFYSRRIGLTPKGYNDVKNLAASDSNISIQKNPGVTQLINAVKLSGRNKNNLGIGIFNAVSAPMYATIKHIDNGSTEQIETSPLTNYNVFVLDQALKGRSSLTFTNTSLIRAGASRDANVSALDFALYDKSNHYGLLGTARYSRIFAANGYDGFNGRMSFQKVSGKLQFELTQNIESDQYDPNDLGYLQAPNEFRTSAEVSYKQRTPTKNFLTYIYSASISNGRLYKPFQWTETEINASAFYFFKNFWDLTFNYSSKPTWQHDYFELRTPGKMLRMMPWHYFGLDGSTDSRKRLFVGFYAGYGFSPAFPQAPIYIGSMNIRYRFSDWLSMEISGEGNDDKGNVGFAFQRETNGDPIIGWRKVKQYTATTSGIINFTPRMFLTFRARHYWSKVNYERFYNVDENGYWIARPFLNGNDNNYNAFNLDVFYTWDFMYGSRFILGWKNWLPGDQYIDGNKYTKYGDNLRRTLSVPQGKELTARLIYFLDYNRLAKKRK